LRAEGVETAGRLAAADEGWVVARFGVRGLEWQQLARGIDGRPVGVPAARRQVSRELTFTRDVSHASALHGEIEKLGARLAEDLRRQPPGKTLTLKLRYADFQTLTRRLTPGGVIGEEALGPLARRLFDENWDGRPVRLLGIGVSNFVEERPGQLSFFEDGGEQL
jgi:DNA polymerase-4